MSERFHNVYRAGSRTLAGKIGRATREEAAGVNPWPRFGMWRVVDHRGTIADLCGPMGRITE